MEFRRTSNSHIYIIARTRGKGDESHHYHYHFISDFIIGWLHAWAGLMIHDEL